MLTVKDVTRNGKIIYTVPFFLEDFKRDEQRSVLRKLYKNKKVSKEQKERISLMIDNIETLKLAEEILKELV